MISKKDIEKQVGELAGLQQLVDTYQEIAALRMRKIRSSVLASRDFNTGLIDIYQELTTSYKAQIEQLRKERNVQSKRNTSIMKRNGKSISIFLSANVGLYGQIINKTFHLFEDSVSKNQTDVGIIGRVGRKLYEDVHPGKPYLYFDFPDVNVDQETINNFIQSLILYENIYLFYGRFETVSQQFPQVLDVYGSSKPQDDKAKGPVVRYIFEPSLDEILVFFEQEIFATLVEQVLLESELAKFASRMITLDESSENIKSEIKKVKLQERIIIHRQINRKQTNSLIGMKLWKIR